MCVEVCEAEETVAGESVWVDAVECVEDCSDLVWAVMPLSSEYCVDDSVS